MNTASAGANTPLDEGYLASFNRIALGDVPAEVLDRFFRIDDDSAALPADGPLFDAYSRNVIIRAMDNGYVPQLLILMNRICYMEIMEAVKSVCPDLPVCLIDEDQADSLSYAPDGRVYSFIRFGISALFRKKPLMSLSDILQSSKKIVIFRGFDPSADDLRDIGAQVRSAAAFFADAVLFESGRIDPYDRSLIRTSAGNNFLVPFTVYESYETLYRALSEHGFTTVLISSGEAEGAVTPDELDCKGSGIAVIVDQGMQKGQMPDPALSYDASVYIPGNHVPGMTVRFTSIVLYSLFV